jgi:hypothetical protein
VEEPVAVVWQGDVGYLLDREQVGAVLALEEGGVLEGAELVGVVPNDEEAGERPEPWVEPPRYGRWEVGASLEEFHRAVDQLDADTVSESYARMVQARRRSA